MHDAITTAEVPILAQHHERRNPGEGLEDVNLVIVMGRRLLLQGTAETSPPSTCKETPVMYEAAGDSKKAAALPSSAGSP